MNPSKLPIRRSERAPNPVTEGDRRTGTHARDCGGKSGRGACPMYCRCWCHGITKHVNGWERADA